MPEEVLSNLASPPSKKHSFYFSAKGVFRIVFTDSLSIGE
jgi:hypothetical protein